MLGLQQSALVYGWRADAPSAVKRRGPVDPLALWRACDQGDFLLARSLLKADPTLVASLNSAHPTKGTTALMAAAKDRSGAEAVRLLLELGADMHVVDAKTRNTALHCAAQSPDVLSTELLLAAGADVCALNADGLMPIDLARRSERSEAARAIMTQMQVHVGWLSVQSADTAAWKRWWAVLVATSANGASTELCLFRSPTHVRPHAVVLVDPATHATLCDACASPDHAKRPKSCQLECPTQCVLAFRLDRPAIYQELKNQRYSRDRSSGRTLSHGSVKIRELAFAADSAKERDAWVAALASETNDSDSARAWSPLSCRPPTAAATTPRSSDADDDDDDSNKCVICASAPRNAICSPCGHLVACYPCLRAATLKTHNKCPICRSRVHSVVRVYTS